MSLESEITNIEREIKNLKDAYEQTALQLPVFTYQIDYTSLNNHLKTTYSDGYSYESDNMPARVVVTFDTETGANTLATLEMMINKEIIQYGMGNYNFKRVPYNGGARWIVYDTQTPTNFTFVVHSAVRGRLGAKMIWQ